MTTSEGGALSPEDRMVNVLLGADPSLSGLLNGDDEERPIPDEAPGEEPEPEQDEAPGEEPEPEQDEAPGEEPEADGEEDEEPDLDEPVTYTLPIGENGADEAVTVEELRNRTLRQADYTRKTQAVAEDRRALEAKSAEVEQFRADYVEAAQRVQKYLESLQPKEPDWADLRATNPAEYAAQRTDWLARQDEIAKWKGEQDRVKSEQAAGQTAKLNEYIRAENAKLLDLKPEWREPATFTKVRSDLIDYGRSLGYTDQDLSRTVAARDILLLHRAMMYDRATAEGKSLVASSTTPVLKPGGKSGHVGAKKRAHAKRTKKALEAHARSRTATSAMTALDAILPEDI